MTHSDMASRSPRERGSVGLLAVLVIVGIVVGGGAFAYFNYFQSPEAIVQRMTAKLADIASLEYSGDINIVADVGGVLGGSANPRSSARQNEEDNLSIRFTGSSDIRNLNDPKGSFSFAIRTDVLPPGEFTFGLETRIIGKTIYVKLSDAPKVGSFDLRGIKDQWIKIDASALKQQFGLRITKGAQEEQELSPEQIEKIKAAVRRAKIFTITEKSGNEEIEGVSTHHYAFVINKEGIKNLLIEINTIVHDKPLTEKELADLDAILGAIESPGGELWVGKNDLLPYKTSLHFAIQESGKAGISGNVGLILQFKNFNKPVQIEIPAPAKTLQEILGGLFGALENVTFEFAPPSGGQ